LTQFELGQEGFKFPKRKLPKPSMTVQEAGCHLGTGRKKKRGNGRRYYLKEMREAKRGYGRLP